MLFLTHQTMGHVQSTPVKDVMIGRFVGSALQNYKNMVEMVGCMVLGFFFFLNVKIA